MKLGKRVFGAASCKLGRTVQLPAHLRNDIIELSALHCDPAQRREGFARSLMQQICQEADAAGQMLMLHVQPYGEQGMTAEQLELWYSVQFGFTAIQVEPRLLARMVGATPRATLKPVALAANNLTT